jgi:3-carboxy-cis,cis-muconate cycloisomerase
MTTSGLFDELFASAAMVDVFSDRARVQGVLDFEAALARAEAADGVIPQAAAEVIASCCRAEAFDFAALARGAAVAGNLAIPLLLALTAAVESADTTASRFVHFGATSQDALDTGLVLQLQRALGLVEKDLGHLSSLLAALSRKHQRTPMLGRTWLQPAPPVTFGMKAAGWLDAVERDRDRLEQLKPRLLVVQFGGAVGTLASLGTHGLSVATHVARQLHLTVPALPWHAARDRIAETGATLAVLVGTLGKLARDVALLMQAEVGEASEPRAAGRGGSSTMPHKQNPVGSAAILSAAARVPQLVATLLAAMPQEHERGLGGWHAEWEVVPEIFRLTSGALKHAIEIAEGLEVDAGRMQKNLAATHGVVLAEPVALALAHQVGRATAQELVERACRRADSAREPLREALRRDPEVSSRLSEAELDRLCDPEKYLGLSEIWVERVLKALARAHRQGES